MTDALRPFRLEVPENRLEDLASRLDHIRWPDEAPNVGWRNGIPLDYLRTLVDHWRTAYDWRAQEARINSFPQFRTEIDGHDIHFIHARSPEPGALPLLLTHGWPGSIVEFLDIIGPLTDPLAHGGQAGDAFDVIIPTIPGFGISGPASGWWLPRVSAAWAELMRRLDYNRYAAHGGDMGSVVSRHLGVVDPDHVVGVHLTDIFTATVTADTANTSDPAEQLAVQKDQRFRNELSAYATLQATRPQTLAYALTDSPLGQLAWIAERFKDWTDSVNAPEDAVDRDQMLTNVMIYWLFGTAGSSARYYKEGARYWNEPDPPTTVPTAVAVMPGNIHAPVRRIAEQTNNIVRWTELPRGGHFAAMEQPDLIVDDLRAAARYFRESR